MRSILPNSPSSRGFPSTSCTSKPMAELEVAKRERVRSLHDTGYVRGKHHVGKLLALNEQSIAAQAQLESAFLAANERGALSADESKEIARLGELAKKTRDPVKEDIGTLKEVLALPLVGGDTAARLAPKSQQDAAVNNAEAAKKAVGALAAAIRKLP